MNRAPCMLEARTGKRCPTCLDRLHGIAFGIDTGGECEWYATLSDVEPMTLGEARGEIAERERMVRVAAGRAFA